MTNLPLPDQLAEQLKSLAQSEGVAVHELLRRMLVERTTRRQAGGPFADAELTARFDAVYAGQPSGLDPGLQRGQSQTIEREDW
jgi:hypothetical protein